MPIRSSGQRPQFTKTYISPNQTITSGGSLTLAHGLGEKPKVLQYVLVCQTAELGYSIGDEYDIGCGASQNNVNQGLSAVFGATNVNIRYGSAGSVFALNNKGTGAGLSNITNANWRLVVRAWA